MPPRRTATPPGLPAALGSPGRRGGGQLTAKIRRWMWVPHVILAFVTGSALAATELARWIAYVVAAPLWLLNQGLHAVFGTGLMGLRVNLAIMVMAMLVVAFFKLWDRSADLIEIGLLTGVGSAATLAGGVPGEAGRWINTNVNALSVPAISDFLGGGNLAVNTAALVVITFAVLMQWMLRNQGWV